MEEAALQWEAEFGSYGLKMTESILCKTKLKQGKCLKTGDWVWTSVTLNYYRRWWKTKSVSIFSMGNEQQHRRMHTHAVETQKQIWELPSMRICKNLLHGSVLHLQYKNTTRQQETWTGIVTALHLVLGVNLVQMNTLLTCRPKAPDLSQS